MRMWMVDPRILCRQHLLGEHLETHMFVGHIKKRKSIKGYIKSNCVEPHSLHQRHRELALEMKRRNYVHNETDFGCIALDYLTKDEIYVKVNVEESLKELLRRCPHCRTNFEGMSK